jgi:hypothetical protein
MAQTARTFEVTLFAAGCLVLQGSGKTYTMGTAAGRSDFSSRAGSTAVIPWACQYVLQYVAAARSKYDITVKVRQAWTPKGLTCVQRVASQLYLQFNSVLRHSLQGSCCVAAMCVSWCMLPSYDSVLLPSASLADCISVLTFIMQASLVEIYNEAIQDLLSPHMTPNSSRTNLLGARSSPVSGSSSVTAAAALGGSNALQQPSTPRSVSSEGGGSAFGSTLSEGGAAAGVTIRETGKGEIVLEGATEAPIRCLEDLAAVLEQGNSVRATAAHK